MKKQQSLQLIPQSIPPSPKKRIHELSYAQKVVQPISADKSHIKLNESLFNAKVTAKESSNYIKDIHKDVQHTIKKYDDFLRLSASKKKITEQICSSPTRPLDFQQEEEALLNDLQKLATSQEVRRFSIPVERSELRLSSYKVKEELFPVDGISPIKQDKSSHISRRNSACNFIQQKNTGQFQSDYYGSYAKIHRKKSPTTPPLFVQPPKEQKTKSPDDVAKRNAEWKQKLQEKLQSEQKKQNEKEVKDCTFKPKIMGRSHTPKQQNKDGKNKNPQFKFEIQEIIHIIDDLHQFSKQLKKKK